MKVGLLVGLPLAIWLFIDILIPSVLSTQDTPQTIDYGQYLGPILGTIINMISKGLGGLGLNTGNTFFIWSPLIFSAMLAFTLPFIIFVGIRFSVSVIASGLSFSLADETLQTLYIFLLFLSFFILAGVPAFVYLQIAGFPFASIFFAATSIAYLIGVAGLIAWGG